MTTPPDPTPAPSTARYARAVLMRLSRGVPTPPLGELILRVGPNSAAETLLHDPAAAAADYGVIVDPPRRRGAGRRRPRARRRAGGEAADPRRP